MERDEMWLNKIKERLDNYAEPLPDNGWQKLAEAMEAGKQVRQGKVVALRRRVMAVAAACLVVVGVGTLMLLYGPDNRTATQDNVLSGRQEAVRQPEDGGDALGKPVRETAQAGGPAQDVAASRHEGRNMTVAEVREKPVPQEEAEARSVDTPPLRETETVEDALPRTEEKQDTLPGRKETNRHVSRTLEPAETGGEVKDAFWPQPRHESGKQKKGWTLALSGNMTGAGNAPSSRLMQTEVSGLRSISSLYSISTRGLPDGETIFAIEEVAYLTNHVREVASIEHKQPVSVGVSVRKNLSHGLSLETGLFYTYLASDVTFAGSNEVFDQKLHYLGIPLRLNWDFFRRGPFVLYASAGGAMEKCVYGQLAGNKETVGPLQWSVLGAVGAQVDLTRRVGFYVEPGVSYYFDDGSAVQTIRKETPCNFTLQTGFRFSY